MIRRLLLRRAAEALVAFTGITLGFRWVRVGVVDNDGLPAAARTFNRAIADHRDGRELLRSARSALEEEEWTRASERYNDAHIAYYEAYERYTDARKVARQEGCPALASDADDYATYCRHMENACESWAKAAERRGSGDREAARERRNEGDRHHERAKDVVETRIPAERNPSNVTC